MKKLFILALAAVMMAGCAGKEEPCKYLVITQEGDSIIVTARNKKLGTDWVMFYDGSFGSDFLYTIRNYRNIERIDK